MFKYLKITTCLLLILLPVLIVRADGGPTVVRYTLNGLESDVTISPTTKKDTVLTISIEADREIKLTRVSICPENDTPECKNYVKYLSPNKVGTVVSAEWGGYSTGDKSPAPAGNYWLRVLLKEGENDSVPINLTNHKITVGEMESSPIVATSTNPTTTPPVTEEPVISSGGGGTSVHSGQSDLSNLKDKTIAVGAGRQRIVLTGDSVAFSAVVSDKTNYGSYEWSFGDGSSQAGDRVSHAYLFPGTYNVVLNASFPSGNAVSRTTVTVIDANLKLSAVDTVNQSVEVSNLSNQEANLNNWLLVAGPNQFRFPKDTIINAQAKLKIPWAVTRLQISSGQLLLARPDGKVISVFQLAEPLIAGTSTMATLNNLSARLLEMKKRVEEINLSRLSRDDGEDVVETVSSTNFPPITPTIKRDDIAEPILSTTGQPIVLAPRPGVLEKGTRWLFSFFR